jgi:hypothetical protein
MRFVLVDGVRPVLEIGSTFVLSPFFVAKPNSGKGRKFGCREHGERSESPAWALLFAPFAFFCG